MSDLKAELRQLQLDARQKLLDAVAAVTDWDVKVQTSGEEWTALHMIRHLQDAHSGLTGQLKRMLDGEQTVPPDFDVDRWNARAQRKAAEAGMSPQQALQKLEDSLADLLAVLDGLSEADWAKGGWQPFLKREVSTEGLLRVIANHEAGHAEEIAVAVG